MGISGNIFKTQGSVYKKCGLWLNYRQVQGGHLSDGGDFLVSELFYNRK
jgi:hypothetical protein